MKDFLQWLELWTAMLYARWPAIISIQEKADKPSKAKRVPIRYK